MASEGPHEPAELLDEGSILEIETEAEAGPGPTDVTGAGVGSLGIGSLKGHDA